MRLILTAILLISVLVPASVSAQVSASKQVPVESSRRFKTYEEAIRYVRNHYARESIDTSRSSWITSAEFFYADGAGYLILGMQGRPYIFAGVPRDVWEGFKGAPSLGRYYHQRIKGRYRFEL